MSDTSIFEWINGLSGHVRIIDEFFKGFANDYFTLVAGMLLMIWLWFFAHSPEARDRNQRTVVLTMISIGMAATAMILINDYLPAHLCPHLCRRPFDVLPPDRINVVYYRPLDSSFPCNYAAIMFSMAFPVLFRYWKYGIWLLAAAIIGGFGRIYMGVHYPLDVLAGVGCGLLGCGVAYVLYWIFGWLIKFGLWLFRFLALA
jgi:undecaprenyl-diphosphatase